MGKEVKTNAVRILERNKVPYELLTYECDEFIDGIHSAEATRLKAQKAQLNDHINDSAFPHNKNNSKHNTQNRRKQIIRLCPLQKFSHEMTPPFEISFATL